MSSNHVNICDFMHTCVLVHVMLGKSLTFTALIFTKQTLFCMTFSQHLTCQLGRCQCGLLIHESMLLPDNSSISGFDNVFTFLYVMIVPSCVTGYYFYLFLFLSIALQIVFIPMLTICILPVIIIFVSGLVGL